MKAGLKHTRSVPPEPSHDCTLGQQSGAPKASIKTVKFPTGQTVIDSSSDGDHVVIKDAQGKITAESWCESGTFDAYFALFTKLKESAARGDRSAVVKLAAYPFRVNAEKPRSFGMRHPC